MRPLLPIAALTIVTSALAAQKAPAKTAAMPAPATHSTWFGQLGRTVEAEVGQDHVVGSFPFRSPLAASIEWRQVTASCACSHLEFAVADRRYWMKPKPKELYQLLPAPEGAEPARVPVDVIPVHAGEIGTVEIHVDLHGLRHQRRVLVDLHSTDAAEPMTRLTVDIRGVEPLVLTPPEVDLGTMMATGRREFTVEVHERSQGDFEILRADPMPPGVQAEWSKAVSNGAAIWTIRGSYGPIDAGRGTGAVLKFATDHEQAPSFALRIHAKVVPEIEVTPGFVALGQIRASEGKRAKVRFHANDGTDLRVVEVAFANLSAAASGVASEVTREGGDVIVEIVVPPGTAMGLLRGDLLVEFDRKAAASQRVLFNGYVRQGR